MKFYFSTHPYARIGLLGIPLFGFILVMESLYPKAVPEGFDSFRVAFEFVSTPQQIDTLFTNFSFITFSNLIYAHYAGIGFAALYALFLGLYAHKAAILGQQRWLLVIIPLSVVVFLVDLRGSLLAIEITKVYAAPAAETVVPQLLKQMKLLTWMKWGSLSLIFLIFALRYNGEQLLDNPENMALILPSILIFWAMTGDPMGISRFALSIIIAFALLLYRSFSNPIAVQQWQQATS